MPRNYIFDILHIGEHMEYTITFTGKHYNSLYEIAEKDFLRWERKAKQGRKQVRNSIRGCLTGVACEAAAGHYIKSTLQSKGIEHTIHMNGLNERCTGKFIGHDISVIHNNKRYEVEVKGCGINYPLGQVITDYAHKYEKQGVDKIILVSFEHNEVDRVITCVVYESISPTKMKEWDIKPNLQGKPCYTHPTKYVK